MSEEENTTGEVTPETPVATPTEETKVEEATPTEPVAVPSAPMQP